MSAASPNAGPRSIGDEKTALFLIQAKAGLPRIYRCLKNKPCVLLSYQTETAETDIYAPDTTWTSGRNKQVEYVKANKLFYDYYIMEILIAGRIKGI